MQEYKVSFDCCNCTRHNEDEFDEKVKQELAYEEDASKCELDCQYCGLPNIIEPIPVAGSAHAH